MGLFGSGGGLAKAGSMFSKIGDGLGYGLDYAMGNDRGVARYEDRQAENEARRLAEQRMTALRQSLQAQGLSEAQINLALTDPGSIGSNFNQRLQPPKPQEPTAFQRNSEYLNSVQPGLGNTYLRNQADPLRFIEAQGPGGTKTLYPMRSGGGTPTGPQPGTVQDGYRFKGGNPNDQNSWEAVGQAPTVPGGQGGSDMGYNGQGAPSISQQEAQTLMQSLGPQGFQNWMRQHRVSIRP